MPEPTQAAPQEGQQVQPPANETFEVWLEKQPQEVKDKYAAHTTGLKSALDGERAARKDLEKQLRDLAKKADAGSEAQKTLTEQADRLGKLEKQSAFYDKAHAAGVRNLNLAYLAAGQADLISDKGDCDFGKLKAAYPELFLAAPQGNAGNGTQGGGSQPFNMDTLIRQKAGRI